MKFKHLYLCILIFGFAIACNPYRKITFIKSDHLFKNKQVTKNIERYDVIVHDKDDNVYELTNTEIDENTLKGTITEIPPTEKLEIDKKSKDPELTKNDIHVYLKSDKTPVFNSLIDDKTIEIDKSEVLKTEMYAKEDRGAVGAIGVLIIIVLSLFIAAILGLIIAISSGASDSGGGGSNSDSGGGGGNGGGSSCYIATMTYGSIDAPEVVLLRKFRDQSLRKYKLGRMFITWYYANSPGFVEKHKSKIWLHKTLRFFLDRLVNVIRVFIK